MMPEAHLLHQLWVRGWSTGETTDEPNSTYSQRDPTLCHCISHKSDIHSTGTINAARLKSINSQIYDNQLKLYLTFRNWYLTPKVSLGLGVPERTSVD